MDPKESRKFINANPPRDYEAERRPSLLGRLFRRSSSTEEGAIQGMNSMQGPIGQMGQSMERRDSITETVQQQFMKKPPMSKPVAKPNPEYNIFT